MGSDFVVVLGEDVESVVGFSSSSIGLSVLGLPVVPEVVNGGGNFGGSEFLGVFHHEVSGSNDGSDGK